MLRQLKKGGRAAVIVPDGVLFGSGKAFKSIRSEIVKNHKLEAVISLPSGVFKPYSGVSTAIIVFTKTDNGGTDNVWFYDMLADGKSLDDKRNLLVDEVVFNSFAFSKALDRKDLNTLAAEHEKFNLPQILDQYRYLKSEYWGKMHDENGELLHVHNIPENLGMDRFIEGTCTHNYADRTSQSFLVPFSEIEDKDWDLSINRYKEIVYEEVKYDAPFEIIDRINKLSVERESILNTLNSSI